MALSTSRANSYGEGIGVDLILFSSGRPYFEVDVRATYSPVNVWYDLKQIATEFVSAGMHSREVCLKHTKNPLRHLWGKQVKYAIKVTFSH